MSDDTTNQTRDTKGRVVQSRDITGIVNLGGTNEFTNVAIGDGATINNYDDRDHDNQTKRR